MRACNCIMGSNGQCCQERTGNIAFLGSDIVDYVIITAPTVGKKYRVPVYRGGWMPASYEGYEVDWNYTEEKGVTK